ncbi:Ankyrin repeat domain containing protein [Pandoravirus neocaledonia]|uniref:Ankyrin repeat domain containing protein n=1 Tax=Pandoravirus neocaledonia TaxID=2107708 RepID=A0A2U7UE17_9VIRU|nr:Ankyrin repeat domain containing protein [Pandoravirus neocaledonia]AVK76652.1 Ankyrin repeat domain containing protein [Pandoravirus neocaledonia]
MRRQRAHGRPRKRRRTMGDRRSLGGAAQEPTVIDMPNEVLHQILGLLDDCSFCAARLAHRRFRVHTADEIKRLRQVPRWLRADRDQLCQQGNAVAVRALCDYGAPFSTRHMAEAAGSGHLDVVVLLHGRALCPTQGVLLETRSRGALDEIESMQDYFVTVDGRTIDSFGNAIRKSGRFGMVGTFGKTHIMDSAAAGGHLDVVEFLHVNRTDGCTADAMDGAAAGGHLDVVEFLHANRTEGCTPWAIVGAARGGHIDMVAWLYRNRPECAAPPRAALDAAARYGHMDTILFLHERAQVPLTQSAMSEAIAGGHCNVAAYLHSHGINKCRPEDMDEAAGNGHLGMLHFLQQACIARCTSMAMTLAAQSGHLDVVTFLHENRTEGCTKKALTSPNPQVVAFLRERYKVVSGEMVRIEHDPGPKKRRSRNHRRRRPKSTPAPSKTASRDSPRFFAAD